MKKGFLFSLLAVAVLASCTTESTEVVEETVVDTTAVVELDSTVLEDEVIDGTSEEVKPEVE
jgi:hypothetical protein